MKVFEAINKFLYSRTSFSHSTNSMDLEEVSRSKSHDIPQNNHKNNNTTTARYNDIRYDDISM